MYHLESPGLIVSLGFQDFGCGGDAVRNWKIGLVRWVGKGGKEEDVHWRRGGGAILGCRQGRIG